MTRRNDSTPEAVAVAFRARRARGESYAQIAAWANAQVARHTHPAPPRGGTVWRASTVWSTVNNRAGQEATS